MQRQIEIDITILGCMNTCNNDYHGYGAGWMSYDMTGSLMLHYVSCHKEYNRNYMCTWYDNHHCVTSIDKNMDC